MPIQLTPSLFAHILLDHEINGRHGLAGNHFANTGGYLNQYLEQLNPLPPQLGTIRELITGLIIQENTIRSLRADCLLNADAAAIALKAHVRSLAHALIHDFNIGQKLSLPGGWTNRNGPGHAMLYQLEKTDREAIRFTLYNSGGGLEKHERYASFEKE